MQGGHKEEIGCNVSMNIRMPGPIVQASQCGESPILNSVTSDINTTNIMRQPVLRWPVEEDLRSTEDKDQLSRNAGIKDKVH